MAIICANCKGLVNFDRFYVVAFVVMGDRGLESMPIQPLCEACYVFIPIDRQTRTTRIDAVTDVFTFCSAVHIRKLYDGKMIDDWNFDLPIFKVDLETIAEFKLHRLLEQILHYSEKAATLYDLAMQKEESMVQAARIRRA